MECVGVGPLPCVSRRRQGQSWPLRPRASSFLEENPHSFLMPPSSFTKIRGLLMEGPCEFFRGCLSCFDVSLRRISPVSQVVFQEYLRIFHSPQWISLGRKIKYEPILSMLGLPVAD
ncbi:hypothetical protein CEXT_537221 [Caerostris extrusa]|uniref:Maturase K n=1 Tax=Caerostris extrusa TaxID=172846 RepID=A0AAV4S5M9_CAEEX|nr:hypothetical protein CEXT_537221 [Caerostris extrusa]